MMCNFYCTFSATEIFTQNLFPLRLCKRLLLCTLFHLVGNGNLLPTANLDIAIHHCRNFAFAFRGCLCVGWLVFVSLANILVSQIFSYDTSPEHQMSHENRKLHSNIWWFHNLKYNYVTREIFQHQHVHLPSTVSLWSWLQECHLDFIRFYIIYRGAVASCR